MKYHFLPYEVSSSLETELVSMRVVLQTRKTFQWHCLPVTLSVWPPGTMWNLPFWLLSLAIACANAELILPRRKLTLSRSISLSAFCTAVAVSPLVESSTNSSTLRPRMPLLALIWSSASWAPINSFLPRAAKVPVSGLSRPILTGSSASDFTTNGLATCMAPIARPALSSVRRRTGRLIRLTDMFTPSGCFLVGSKGWPLCLDCFHNPIKRMSHIGKECNAEGIGGQFRGPKPPAAVFRHFAEACGQE